MAAKKEETPQKIILFFSPSAHDICLNCHKNISPGRRKLLWKESRLSESGIIIERLSGINLDRCKDFNIVCQNCFKKIESVLKKKEEIEKNRIEGREIAHQFVRKRSKRGKKIELVKSERRKKLFKSPIVDDDVDKNGNDDDNPREEQENNKSQEVNMFWSNQAS